MEMTEIREKIDRIDDQFLKLFLDRMELSRQIAEVKARDGLPILNKERERQILRDVADKSGEYELYSHRLFSTVLELSRTFQRGFLKTGSAVRDYIEKSLSDVSELFPETGLVACQGVEGAYSQMAADRMFPRGNILYVKTFEAVFEAVQSGLCRFGIVPIENSSNGSVRAVYDLLQVKDLSIVRSERLCISHELLVKPGVKLSEVKKIVSHEQALGQCSAFLKSLGDRVEVEKMDNTAVAARFVAESPDRSVAAISSSNCAELYGLEALNAGRIQNSDNNYTRFICLSKKPVVYPGANRISLVLSCEHRPGALYDVLSHISALELNLIKLESCPMVGHDFEFLFFLDIEASVRDPKVVDMLESLEHSCRSLRYLGNYQEI